MTKPWHQSFAVRIFFVLSLLFTLLVARNLLSQQSPPETVEGLKAAEGLEVTLWASEPDVVNPTNIDIDERGRVWVLEAVNYRRTLSNQSDYRPEGDRITILEDADSDGKADRSKVFLQDKSLRSPLGIAVLGNQVIVSQSPDLIVFTKDDQDHIIKKEVLLTGWRGADHDHGVHAIAFGPDGRYYLNAGDQGFDVTDKSGRRFASSKAGPYYAGCAIRINPDGTDFTILGHNFRNPYELALDSFGTIWQTDNDDDGNKWVRVNYVMEGGNFGYWGPGGRHWREDKGSHFHNELPGVVPNVARTGQGAPCGVLVYEGKLLPQKYGGQVIHAESGKRLINTYFPSADGAGYSIKIEDTVAAADTWFRPSDVCVSPDGAIFISDWYDPSVGGHQMQDIQRGRIYRLAPIGSRPQRPKVDLESAEGLSSALASPAQSVRSLAYRKLEGQGPAALPLLRSMWQSGDRVLKARALWLLGALSGEGEKLVREALGHEDPDVRILAMRVLRRHGADPVKDFDALLRDPSPRVRRELAIALREAGSEAAVEPLVELCKQYDREDRWYLEALGIGARGKENLLYPRLKETFPGKWNSALGQLLWEFRPSDALPDLVACLNDAGLKNQQRLEALQVLSAMSLTDAGTAVASFVHSENHPSELRDAAFARLAKQLFSEWIALRKDPAVTAAVKKALMIPNLQSEALALAADLEDTAYAQELLGVARSTVASESSRALAIEALGRTRSANYTGELEKLSEEGPLPLRVAAVRALSYLRPEGLVLKLKQLILSPSPNEMRAEGVRALARSEEGLNLLLDLEEGGELPSELRTVAAQLVNAVNHPAIKKRAEKLLPPQRTKNEKPLPSIRNLHWRTGEVERGRQVFFATEGPKCSSCHSLNDGRRTSGPDLSSIGGKLGKEALLEAILNPSAGIAPEFYVWIIETKAQGDVIGVLKEDTPQRLVVQTETGDEIRLKPFEIKSRRRSNLSLMSENLVSTITEQELVDLMEFLTTLKQEAP